MSNLGKIGEMAMRFRDMLEDFEGSFPVHGVKMGTEFEANTFDELFFMRTATAGLFPLTVKVGGCDARNDISYAARIGANVILAPMVETHYALENFARTMAELTGPHGPRMAINIETVTACGNLPEMAKSIHWEAVRDVTIGRSDLARSMTLEQDNGQVMALVSGTVRRLKEWGKCVSVGGNITVDNCEDVAARGPDLINTRHFYLDLSGPGSLRAAVHEALEIETWLYEILSDLDPARREHYNILIEKTRARQCQSVKTCK